MSKKPLIGISVFNESGSLLGSSNERGIFQFNKTSFAELNIKKLVFYHHDYFPLELQVDALSSLIYLEKIKTYELDAVGITAKRSGKYFGLNAYVRSWKLLNGKLVRYGDALIDYQIPFERSKAGIYLEKNKYVKAFRNFKIDSIKTKSKVLNISLYDSYFREHLPGRDLISSVYTAKQFKDSLYTVYDENKDIGYALYDKNNMPAEINIGRSFEGDEAIKIALWWKIAGKSKDIEKWTGTGETRRPVYIFSNKKILLKSKVDGKFDTEEIVTELFIDDHIVYQTKLPEKYKSKVNIDESFYASTYWLEEIKKHPLPSQIQEQLNTVKELKNTYQ